MRSCRVPNSATAAYRQIFGSESVVPYIELMEPYGVKGVYDTQSACETTPAGNGLHPLGVPSKPGDLVVVAGIPFVVGHGGDADRRGVECRRDDGDTVGNGLRQ